MPGGGVPGAVAGLACVGWKAELAMATGGLVAGAGPEGIRDFVCR